MPLLFVFVGVLVVVVVVVAWTLMSREKNEAWKQFANEVGAEFIDGGFFRGSKVVAHIKNYTITLDT